MSQSAVESFAPVVAVLQTAETVANRTVDETKETEKETVEDKTAEAAATATTTDTPPPLAQLKFTTTSYPTRSLDFLLGVGHVVARAAQPVPSTPAKCVLDVIVVGAGIGGLATAIALARRGHMVRVFEQAPVLAEVGAGIQVPPNSGRLLRRWGVMDALGPQAVSPEGISFRRWKTGTQIGYTKLGADFARVYEEPYHVVHRAHLHQALHARAEVLGVSAMLNSRVVGYGAAADAPGTVVLGDGSVHGADLIVAADGIKSLAREYLNPGPESQPRTTGYAAYRATVPVERLQAHPELGWVLAKPGLNVWIGEDKHVMTYLIAGGHSFNMVLAHHDDRDPATMAAQPADAALQDMRAAFADWDPTLCIIISLIDHVLKWPLMESGTVDTWFAPSARLAVLGDATHAMLPYMSQGAAMAVEDGAALAVVLSHVSSKEELPFALRLFAAERKRRSLQMKEASQVNSMLWHFRDGPEQAARDAAMRPEVDGNHYLASPNQWSDPVTQQWAYGYDAEAAMEACWDAAVQNLILGRWDEC